MTLQQDDVQWWWFVLEWCMYSIEESTAIVRHWSHTDHSCREDSNEGHKQSSCTRSDQDAAAAGLFLRYLPPPANVVMVTLQLF